MTTAHFLNPITVRNDCCKSGYLRRRRYLSIIIDYDVFGYFKNSMTIGIKTIIASQFILMSYYSQICCYLLLNIICGIFALYDLVLKNLLVDLAYL